jgi:PAS domain S-box-containing protein
VVGHVAYLFIAFSYNSNDLSCIANVQGYFEIVNPNWEKLLGYSEKELQESQFLNFIHPDDIASTLQEIEKLKIGVVTINFVNRYRKKDGSYLWLDWNSTSDPVKGKLYAIARDITERKNAEDQIKKLNVELEKKVIERTNALEVQNTQFVDFCNIVSHNLRAPLVNIVMLVDYIEQSKDEEERNEMIGKIKPVVTHLNEVFSELVESVQVRQDVEIKSEKIILKDCLNDVLIGFETQIKLLEAKLEINFDAATIIFFPRKYIDSIFTNLVSNALKYKSPDRKPIIKIKTEKRNDTVVLSVSDNGLGIDLNMHRHKLFKIRKVFHEHPEANGFGLFMTKTQVDAMGGKIWAESDVDKGTTFYIEFKNQN